ncbi:Permease of the drug/metabolite transporter (DMT) superfamily [Micromonospora echinospora]|uniref:Permease of the drug/metabolite transporter (DMT) superfamily n=1 Tax=Micromonospora echinospora TaxID=1877 RepID=A0A1C4ZRG9_MICEC|nr:Permease of the drug/metabolite transporter (DMT) superfamily [Micromonospora echinospora]
MTGGGSATVARTDNRGGVSVDAHLYLLTTMALFGSAFASSKVVVGHLPHQVAAVLRFGGGAVILLLITLAISRRGTGTFSWRDALRAGAVGLLGVFGYNVFFFWGLSLAPSIDGSVIVPVLSPVITTAVMLVVSRERPSSSRLTGLLLGLGGAVVFFLGAGVAIDSRRLTGDLVYLAGAVAWAAYSITSKRVLNRMDPLRATTSGTVVGALALAVFAAPSVGDADWSAVPGHVWVNVVYLAVGPTAVAYLFYYRGLRAVSPTTATVMMFSSPLFGITCSVAFLGESFHALQVVGALIMLVGALLAVGGQFVRRDPPAAEQVPDRAGVASEDESRDRTGQG